MNTYQVDAKKEIFDSKTQEGNLSFLNLANGLLLTLDKRSREIVQRRFGLLSEKEETLEKIGKHYGITRERVRQILSEALKKISINSNSDFFSLAEKKILFTINKNNGIIKKGDISEKFNLQDMRETNAVKFFVVCFKNIFEVEEKKVFKKILVSSKEILTDIKKIIQETEKIIVQENKLFADSEIYAKLATVFPHISENQFFSFLDASHSVGKNKFGKWGITDWTEVNPKGTREKVFLVLKEHKNPLHFMEIAKMIDKLEFGKRKAHPQTVHNELIKDNRFVLVGRGIYALAEWGYSKGTIREVIKQILEKSAKPLTKEEIILEVLKSRKVKKTTIMINLNNKNFFNRKGDFYTNKK